jgi:hypothetical protein
MHHSPAENPVPRRVQFEPRRRARRCRAVLVAGVILAFSLAAAGCGGSPSSPGVATVATTTTAAGPPAAGSTQATGLVAYATCMRSHGVTNFPDPSAGGGIPKQAVVSAFGAVGNAQSAAASTACAALMPAGGLSGKTHQTVPVQDRQDYLRAAACMRSHGIADFPDPTFPNNSVQVDIPSTINQSSTQFVRAATTCAKLIPTGLPYTRASGS